MEEARSWKRCRVVKGGLRVHLIPKVAHSSIGNTIGELVIDNVYPTEDSDDYRVMVVRHPLDRMVSSWAFFTQKRSKHALHGYLKSNYCKDPNNSMLFKEWCKGVMENYSYDPHFDKQVIFTGGQTIDALIKMENLNTEWPIIAKRFKLPNMLYENSSEHNFWRGYYTPELKAEAEEVFSEDIILYNDAR